MTRRVVVDVPATTSNLGPGFDCLGLAVDMWNRFEFELGGREVLIKTAGASAPDLPTGRENLIYQAFQNAVDNGQGSDVGMKVTVYNHVPISSGLGSSATAIVAGTLAANALRDVSLSESELITLASRMEGHPDNVAPAILGGLVVAVMPPEGDVVALSVPAPRDLRVVLAVPSLQLNTGSSRAVLPTSVPWNDAVFNVSRAALWVAAAVRGDFAALEMATQDALHQPYRKSLIPGIDELFAAARSAGAFGVALSGAGPSVVAFCDNEHAVAVEQEMRQAASLADMAARVMTTSPSYQGAVSNITGER